MIYFLRHAQSEANEEGVYAGSKLDTKLTKNGILRLKETAQKNTIIFKKIYVSTLSRSIESGRIFLAEQPYTAEMIPDERINELDFGDLTGLPYINFDTEQAYETYNIERSKDLHERVLNFYNNIKDDEGPILVLAHAGVGKMLQTIMYNKQAAEYNKNEEVKQYRIYEL